MPSGLYASPRVSGSWAAPGGSVPAARNRGRPAGSSMVVINSTGRACSKALSDAGVIGGTGEVSHMPNGLSGIHG